VHLLGDGVPGSPENDSDVLSFGVRKDFGQIDIRADLVEIEGVDQPPSRMMYLALLAAAKSI